MAQPNLSISVLNTYNVQAASGKEDLKTLQYFKEAGLQYLKDVARKDDLPENVSYPDKWRNLLKAWVVKGTRAEDLLERPDYTNPTKFFDKLISRISVV
jgi:hypothetical protein